MYSACCRETSSQLDISEVRADNANRHPWEISRRSCLVRLLGRKEPDAQFVDVGAGDMYFSKALGALSRRPVIAVDPGFPSADLGLADGIRRFTRIEDVPPGIGDCVVAMDVLEHVPDDVALLTAIAARARPGGEVLITVPAFQFLFSGQDRYLRHERRYDKKRLSDLLRACSLRPVELFYFYSSLFVVRSVEKALQTVVTPRAHGAANWKHRGSHPLTRAIQALLDVDFALGRKASAVGVSLPGLSLCARCQKPSV